MVVQKGKGLAKKKQKDLFIFLILIDSFPDPGHQNYFQTSG